MDTDWIRISGLKDFDQCSCEWERKFVDLLNKHALFKHRNVRNTDAPYIDNELRHPNDWTQYKRIKNEINVELKNKRSFIFLKN